MRPQAELGGLGTKGKCVKPYLFITPPSLTRFTNVTHLGRSDSSDEVYAVSSYRYRHIVTQLI